MKTTNIRMTTPHHRLNQYVMATVSKREKVLCQIQRREWNTLKKKWTYFCRDENGHPLFVTEQEIEAIGPKPVEEKLLNIVEQQEYALRDAILASLDEALEDFDANNISIKTDECTYEGIFKDENGFLQTMQTYNGTKSQKALKDTNILILVNLFHQYVWQSTKRP